MIRSCAHFSAIFVLAATLLACPKAEEPVEPPKQLELTKTAPPPPPVAVAAPPATSTSPPSRAELIKAYADACDYQVKLHIYDDSGEIGKTATPECAAREFEQNCAPDRYGCWDNLEKCKDGCAQPCNQCESSCAASCTSCKVECKQADPKACIAACAERRLGCRQGCVKKLDECRTVTCPKEEATCYQTGIAKVAKECGSDCKPFGECVMKTVYEAGGKIEVCHEKFPKLSESCRGWCLPDE